MGLFCLFSGGKTAFLFDLLGLYLDSFVRWRGLRVPVLSHASPMEADRWGQQRQPPETGAQNHSFLPISFGGSNCCGWKGLESHLQVHLRPLFLLGCGF